MNNIFIRQEQPTKARSSMFNSQCRYGCRPVTIPGSCERSGLLDMQPLRYLHGYFVISRLQPHSTGTAITNRVLAQYSGLPAQGGICGAYCAAVSCRVCLSAHPCGQSQHGGVYTKYLLINGQRNGNFNIHCSPQKIISLSDLHYIWLGRRGQEFIPPATLHPLHISQSDPSLISPITLSAGSKKTPKCSCHIQPCQDIWGALGQGRDVYLWADGASCMQGTRGSIPRSHTDPQEKISSQEIVISRRR